MTDPMILKRPKANEDEDDLLRMQEEFIQTNSKPSVNISYSNQSNNQNKFPKPRAISKFVLNKKLKTQDSEESLNIDNVKKPSSSSSFILGNIVEKNTAKQFNPKFSNELNDDSLKSGFPSIFIFNDSTANENESLFLQAISKNKNTISHEEIDVKFEDYGLITEEDILCEKRKLESTLNPNLIEFIKRRKKEKDRLKEENKKKIIIEDTIENEEIPEMIQEIFTEAKKNNWIHMDVVEKEKGKWMMDVKENKKVNLNESYNARFDFNGILLPFNDENITIDKGLHHHGDEPERPGYSLQELLQLCRSSSLQQRSIALQTLSHIIEKSRRGWYDSVLNPAPLTALNEKNLFLLLRFSIDDSSTTVVTAALHAMRNFLYNEEDEICLDRLFGLNDFAEPILKPNLKDLKDVNSLKDHELAQLDTIATSLRSDIIKRIRYILSEMQPPPDGVSAALEILIRLCRHSALQIISVVNLLDCIVKNFIPFTTDKLINEKKITNAYGVPIISALRFCRIFITYAGKPAAIKLCRLNIIGSIVSYLSSEAGTHGIFLHIECLRLWKILLLHDFTHDVLQNSHIILNTQLKIFIENLNIGQCSELYSEHATALISVLSHEVSFRSDIVLALKKWSTQLSNISLPTWGNMKLILQTLLAVEDISEGCFQTKWIVNSKIFENLNSTSNLLSGFSIAKERNPSSLPSLGALTENGQLQPLLSQNSCFPFLSQALQFFMHFSHKNEIEIFFSQLEFVKYISSLSNCIDWSLENSWFTRIEFNFLINVIKCGKIIENNLSSKMKNILSILAIKLISTLPGDYSNQTREILHYILDPQKLSVDEILKNLEDLKLDNKNQSKSINLSKELIIIYESYIPLKGNWEETSLPKDWIFLPLIDIYRNLKNSQQLDIKDTEKIVFVLNLYKGLPELVENLTPNLQFSRLILVFLCETVFNEKNVSPLIENIVSSFLKKYNKKLDLTKDVPGLSSFTDMFTELCENFFSHSYGNNNFALILLTFILQRHDVHYRKMLWSEHAGTLRYIRITVDNLLYSIDEFLYPIEMDISLIECYIRSLIHGIVKKEWCSIPYIIALHHSGMFLKNSENQLAIQMKNGLEKLKTCQIANEILNYDPNSKI
ncbi:RNA polymerase II-associated protein 1 [Leptopilina boulardi]|uniref:RNA polymerase II-associated protein 1 n=1 Tax=Leptopilina boulardi TaxID=63433 RepID=UPI0021F5E395|nr:RNA polymerase II-associated protein 1 [Leptopilina boulardi]